MRTSSSTGDIKENVWKVTAKGGHPEAEGQRIPRIQLLKLASFPPFVKGGLGGIFLIGFTILSFAFVSCAKKPAYKQLPKKAPFAKVEHERAPETGAKKEIIRNEPRPPATMATPQARASAKLLDDGRQKMSLGEFDPAKRSFEEAINIDPSNGIAYYYLARAKYELGEYQQALGVLDKAEELLSGSKEWEETVQTLREMIREHNQ